MTKRDQRDLFVGDITSATEVPVKRRGDTLSLTLEKALAERLGRDDAALSAATVDLGRGRNLLLLSTNDGAGPLRVTRSGEGRIEVAMAERDAENAADLVVDEVTEAFLTLKKERFARGELDLSGLLTAEDLEALSQQDFDRIKRLLDK